MGIRLKDSGELWENIDWDSVGHICDNFSELAYSLFIFIFV